jgi:hypothetical protein
VTLTETVSNAAARCACSGRVASLVDAVEANLLDDLERLRQDTVLLALLPYAAPRLPGEYLRCFDAEQRQIRPTPEQMAERARRTRPGLLIPEPRRPMPGEVLPRAWPR